VATLRSLSFFGSARLGVEKISLDDKVLFLFYFRKRTRAILKGKQMTALLIVLGIAIVLLFIALFITSPTLHKKTGGSISASGNVRIFADSKGTTIESDSGGCATVDGKSYDLKPGDKLFISKK